MSSPIARTKKNLVRRVLIKAHQRASHDHRIELLGSLLAETFVDIGIAGDGVEVGRGLDIGCGDMSLAETVSVRLPDLQWKCIDIHPAPKGAEHDVKWNKYSQFDGRSLAFPDQSFRVAVLCDVLHHASPDDQQALLSEAARVAEFVVVKDHFEFGLYSRSMLQGMDFIGNWAYGVSVPRRYFRRAGWESMMRSAGVTERKRVSAVALYDGHPVLRRLLNDKWQFISATESVRSRAERQPSVVQS